MVPDFPLENIQLQGVHHHLLQYLEYWCNLLDAHFTHDCVAKRYTTLSAATTDLFYRTLLPYIQTVVSLLPSHMTSPILFTRSSRPSAFMTADVALFRGSVDDVSGREDMVHNCYAHSPHNTNVEQLRTRWTTLLRTAERHQNMTRVSVGLEATIHALSHNDGQITLLLE